jgi:hypothetical protein
MTMTMTLQPHLRLLAFVTLCGVQTLAQATGLATCDSGPKSGWQAAAVLEKMLTDKGYTVRRIKEDGGCYEVYALDDKGQRAELYFHPVTLAPVPTQPRR